MGVVMGAMKDVYISISSAMYEASKVLSESINNGADLEELEDACFSALQKLQNAVDTIERMK
jgi:hypothetical protein